MSYAQGQGPGLTIEQARKAASEANLAIAKGENPAEKKRPARGERAITGDTALRLARLFGVDAAFWINLQAQYDLDISYRKMHKIVEKEVTPLPQAA